MPDIRLIRYKKWPIRPVKPRKKPVEFIGFDTETTKQGKGFLLCDGRERSLRWPTIETALPFLTNKEYRFATCGFWNLQFDTDVLAKLLSSSELRRLVYVGEAKYGEYVVRLIGHKALIITTHKNRWTFTDFAPFYALRLDDAGRIYLNEGKNLPPHLQVYFDQSLPPNKRGIPHDAAEHYIGDFERYCMHDAWMAEELMRKWQDMIASSLDFSPRKWFSPASVAEEYYRNTTKWPSLATIPDRVIRAAYHAYAGGRFELCKRGRFQQKLYLADITWAYPSEMRWIPDIACGTWRHGYGMSDVDGVGFGYVRATLMPSEHTSPFWKRSPHGLVYYPLHVEGWKTFDEIVYAKEQYAWADFTVEQTWRFTPSTHDLPFKQEIERLWRLRKKLKDAGDERELPIKQVGNSGYGKAMQKIKRENIWKAGTLFNPVLGSLITARVRLKILDANRSVQDDLIENATDSVIALTKPKVTYGTDLGEWKLETYDDGVFLQSGVRTMIGDKHKSFFRGFNKEVDFFPLLAQHRGSVKIPIRKLRPQHLRECVVQEREDDIAQFLETEKDFNVNGDCKRRWSAAFTSAAHALRAQHVSVPRPW